MAIEFKLTRNPQLLSQYYELREACYRKELGLPDFDGSEDVQDLRGSVLLAVEAGRCVGGARIVPTGESRAHLRRLGVRGGTSCQWERFVFAPEVRSVPLIRDFVDALITWSCDVGYDHAIVLSSLRNARFYRQCHTALGVGFKIHRQVPHCIQSEFAGLEHYLSVSYLRDRQLLSLVA